MTTLTVKLKRLHPAQECVYNSQARFTVLACGRRFGKTELGLDKLANAVIDTSLPYFYIAPTYADMLKFWDDTNILLYDLIADQNKQERRVQFLTGAMLWFFSFDAVDRMRGKPFAGGIADEAAAAPNLEYAWTRVIMPTLADYRGWCWFLSSFRGKNYFHQLYTWGIDPLKPEWAGFSFPTSSNPFIHPDEITLAQRTLPERAFQEEYMAIPNEEYGAVFRGVLDCIRPVPETAGSVVLGVDFARNQDFTVIVALDETTKQVIAIDRFNEVNWTIQRGRIEAMAKRYNARLILAESNAIGEPNIEELQKTGLNVRGFQTTATSKPPLIDALALAIEQQNIGLVDDPVLINELQGYEMQRTSSGNWKYGAPNGGHDDCVIALALAYHAATEYTPFVFRVIRKGNI